MKKLLKLLFPILFVYFSMFPAISFANPYTDELSLLKNVPIAHMKKMRGDAADADGFTGENKHSGYIGAEYQRDGMKTLITGVVLGKRDLIDEGFRIADATFSRQLPDGGFGDPLPRGAAFFITWVARAFQILKESEFWPQYETKVEGYYPKIELALDFLSNNRESFVKHDDKAPNRFFIEADAFFLSSKLIGKNIHLDDAYFLQNLGLTLYDPVTGVFMENGGGDSSYQAVNLLMLMYYVTVYPSASIDKIIQNGEKWEMTKVLSDGSIDVTGNSRTGVGKEMYFGHPKNVNFREVNEMFDYYALLYDDPDAKEAAQRIFHHHDKGGK